VGRWLEVAGIVVAAICVVIEVYVAWVAIAEVVGVTSVEDPALLRRAFIEVADEAQNLQNLFHY